MTEPPKEMEEEFNAWYDSEHLHERLSIPGFVSARRWVDPQAQAGSGKYLATYELDSPQVLETPEYLAHVGDNFTPWSKRCLSRCLLFRRWACEQISPIDTLPDPAAQALFLSLCDLPAELETQFNRWQELEQLPLLRTIPGTLSARRFRATSGEPRHIGLYELADAGVAKHRNWRAGAQTHAAQRTWASAEQWRCYQAYNQTEHA